jgi:hypothetical protein
MLVMLVCLLAALSPLLLGRSLAPLAGLRLRWLPLVWLTLVSQFVLVYVSMPKPVGVALHLAGYAAAAVVIWINRALPGLVLIGLGAASNGVTIALNGGTLPARAAALDAAGFEPDLAFENSGVLADPVLPWLGDVFAWPEPLPLSNVFSVGDVLVVLGVGYGAHRLASRRTPAVQPTAVTAEA